MKNLQELQASLRLLDLVGASSTQYFFISKEDYEIKWGWIEKNNYEYVFPNGTQHVRPLGTLTACGYMFVFIDPSNLECQPINPLF